MTIKKYYCGGSEDILSTDGLIEKIAVWGQEKGINNPYRQLNKVIEELGELSHEICRDRFDSLELKDAIGDVLVTVIVLANICKQDPIECLEGAYHEISSRKGKTSKGMFIKEAGA